MGAAYRRNAALAFTYSDDIGMRKIFFDAAAKVSEIRPQRLDERSRGSVRMFLKDYEVNKSQVARGARDGIYGPGCSAGVSDYISKAEVTGSK